MKNNNRSDKENIAEAELMMAIEQTDDYDSLWGKHSEIALHLVVAKSLINLKYDNAAIKNDYFIVTTFHNFLVDQNKTIPKPISEYIRDGFLKHESGMEMDKAFGHKKDGRASNPLKCPDYIHRVVSDMLDNGKSKLKASENTAEDKKTVGKNFETYKMLAFDEWWTKKCKTGEALTSEQIDIIFKWFDGYDAWGTPSREVIDIFNKIHSHFYP